MGCCIHRIWLFSLMLSFSFLICSCKQSGSKTSVVGGEQTDAYPAVVEIKLTPQGSTGTNICTASIVSPNTLITAAHCFLGPSKVSTEINGHQVVARQYMVNPEYDDNDIAKYRFDVAVIVFDNTPFASIFPLFINADKAVKNTEVRMVGYGCHTKFSEDTNRIVCDHSQADYKRTGTSVITSLNNIPIVDTTQAGLGKNSPACTYGLIELETTTNTSDADINEVITSGNIVSPGDSGGPLLLKSSPQVFIGVASRTMKASKDSRKMTSCYAPFSKDNLKFLKEAEIKLGANIPGV